MKDKVFKPPVIGIRDKKQKKSLPGQTCFLFQEPPGSGIEAITNETESLCKQPVGMAARGDGSRLEHLY
jgi:hypothetical protein